MLGGQDRLSRRHVILPLFARHCNARVVDIIYVFSCRTFLGRKVESQPPHQNDTPIEPDFDGVKDVHWILCLRVGWVFLRGPGMLTIDSERELPVPRIAFWGHKLVMREFHLRNRRGHESSMMADGQGPGFFSGRQKPFRHRVYMGIGTPTMFESVPGPQLV